MNAPHNLPIQIRSACFVSRKFDLEAEPENDINPIRGQSFLAWLRPRLEGLGYTVDGPDTEDWGWYLDVRGPATGYIVGASADKCDEGADWTIRLSRQRSFRDWITGKGWIAREDPLVGHVERIVREETEATEVWYESGCCSSNPRVPKRPGACQDWFSGGTPTGKRLPLLPIPPPAR